MKPPVAEVLTATLAIGMIVEAGRDVLSLVRNVAEKIERRYP